MARPRDLRCAALMVPLHTRGADYHRPGNSVIGFLEPFTPALVRSYLGRWSIGHPLFPLASLPGRAAVAIVVIGLAVGLAGVMPNLLRANANRALPRLPARTVLIVVLAVAPPAEIALYSAIGNSVWEARNLIAGSPALMLLFGAIVTSAPGILRVAAVGLVIVGFAIGAAKMLDSSYRRPDYNAAVNFIDRVGASGDPVIDLLPATPGPLTELDAAFALAGRSARAPHPVLRLGYPPLTALLHARPYAPLSPTPSDVVIRRAVALARGRTLFLVGFQGEVRLFLKSIPPPIRAVGARTFPGLVPVSAYVFRDG
jgi:hypothetical protein